MILIEVNNGNTTSNSELLAKTTNWAEANIQGRYTIVLNPHLEQEMRITYHTLSDENSDTLHESGESNHAPQETNTLDSDTDGDTIF